MSILILALQCELGPALKIGAYIKVLAMYFCQEATSPLDSEAAASSVLRSVAQDSSARRSTRSRGVDDTLGIALYDSPGGVTSFLSEFIRIRFARAGVGWKSACTAAKLFCGPHA